MLRPQACSDGERTLAGYKAQCELLAEQLELLVAGCEARQQSLICEGEWHGCMAWQAVGRRLLAAAEAASGVERCILPKARVRAVWGPAVAAWRKSDVAGLRQQRA